MREGSDYVFDSVDLLHYRIPKISLSRGGSYIDSPKWLKNKRATSIQKTMMTNVLSML